jgi:spermidine synthase
MISSSTVSTTKLFALVVMIVVGVIGLANVASAAGRSSFVIFEQRSLYRNITVTESNSVRCLRFDSRRFQDVRQSCINLMHPDRLVFDYTKMVLTGAMVVPDPQRILVIGLGGGTIPRAFQYLYPDVHVTSIEIDPAVVEVAEEYFDFTEGPQQDIVVADGRVWIKRALHREERFDIIVLDAFNGDYIPEHLLTREFLEEARALLTDDGIVVANTFSISRLYDSESVTYDAAFDWMLSVKKDRGNRIILAGSGEAPSDAALIEGAIRLEMEHDLSVLDMETSELMVMIRREADWDEDAVVLTDEYSPANLLNSN